MKTKNLKRKQKAQPGGSLKPAGSEIVIQDEQCLLHSDIDRMSNKGTAALDGGARDGQGNAWELSAYVTVKWKRMATGFGQCKCGGQMVSKAPNHKNARVRCNKCAAEMFLSNWRRISPNH